jgi:hypothetical protein
MEILDMAQANSIANITRTRRKALTAIATLAGATAVVTPVVAAQAIAHPDAELLALGQELRGLIPSYAAVRDEHDRLHRQTSVQVDREVCPMRNDISVAELKARDEAYERIGQENGTNTACEAWRAICDRMFSLTGPINEAEATTLEGLAVKGIATAWETDDRNMDERLRTACLINSVMEAAGQELPRELWI